MMTTSSALLFAMAVLPHVSASSVSMCTEENCETCPNSLIVTAATDDRPCIVYATSDIVSGEGYPPESDSGQEAWVSGVPDNNTVLAIRSPSDPGYPSCGNVAGYVNSLGTCGHMSLKETMAIEMCIGVDDCLAKNITAGPYVAPSDSRRIRGTNNIFEARDDQSGQNFVAAVKRSDGSIVRPLAAVLDGKDYMREFLELFNASHLLHDALHMSEQRRYVPPEPSSVPDDPPPDDSCTEFKADDPAGYIRSSYITQSVSSNVEGGPEGSNIERTAEIQTSWSTTVSAGLNIEIFSAGVDFTTSETISKSVAYTVSIPPDESGYMGFTPYLRCAKGSATCGSESRPGEACTPFADSTGNPAGEFTFVQHFE